MKLAYAFAAIAALGITSSAGAASAAPQPLPGDYDVYGYVTANSCSFDAPVGTYFNSHFFYPGPGKTGAVEIIPAQLGSHGAWVQAFALETKAPAAGKTNWTGHFTLTQSAGSGDPGPFTGTFKVTLGFFDEVSFEGTITYTTGTCAQTRSTLFVKSD